MKKLSLFVTVLLFTAQGNIYAQFAGGSGIQGDPYLISTPAQLNEVRNHLSSWFELTNDIDLDIAPYNTGSGWEPIGTSGNPFTGFLFGSTYTISNLFIDRTSSDYVGLFGFIFGSGTNSVKLTNVDVTGRFFVGGLAGQHSGDQNNGGASTSNNSVTGSISGTSYVGGLYGRAANASISTANTNVTVTASQDYAGGIAGSFETLEKRIDFSYTEGSVSTGDDYAGGIAGVNYGKIVNSFSNSKVTATDDYAGGITGQLYGEITQSASNNEVTGDDNVGGLVGYINDGGEFNPGTITDSYSTATVTGDIYVGGIAGFAKNGEITRSVTFSKVNAVPVPAFNIINGGFLGGTLGTTDISNSYWSKELSGQTYSMTNNDSAGVSRLEISEMIQESSFSGFDFTNDWEIFEGFSFPYLKETKASFFGPMIHPVTTLSGSEGWRQISTPVEEITYKELFDTFWTQGFPGADAENGNPNILIWDESSKGWNPPDSANSNVEPGIGILFYAYEKDDFVSGEFPKTLITSGTENESDVSEHLVLTFSGDGFAYDAVNDGWNFVGNPYPFPIDWDNVNWTKTNIDAAYYIWNNASNAYQSWNGAIGTLPNNGVIAPYQGFWVKANNSGSPFISFSPNTKTTGGALLKRTISTPVIRLRFSENDDESGLSSEALIAFIEQATMGKDPYDAWKLAPLASEYLSGFTMDGEGASYDINSLPLNLTEEIEIPLDYILKTTKNIEELGLNWSVENLPSDWEVTITDNEIGESVDMLTVQSLSFGEIIRSKKAGNPLQTSPEIEVIQIGKQKSTSARFKVTINPVSAVSNTPELELPKQFSLSQNYPNPFNPSTQINFELPKQSNVELTVFDMLGREVAILVQGQKEAGYHSVNFDASNLSSGVYIYRLEVGTKVFTKKMSLIK